MKSPVDTLATAARLAGVDLAKNVFSVCEVDAHGRVLRRQNLRRETIGLWLPQLAAGTVVAMEACSGAHHWARRCHAFDLQPRIMAAQFVTPFRKGRKTKNNRAGLVRYSFAFHDSQVDLHEGVALNASRAG